MALLRGKVAQALFTRNRDADALSLAADAFLRAPPDARPRCPPSSPAWPPGGWAMPNRQTRSLPLPRARRSQSSEDRAAAAWWAARASQRLGDADGNEAWLQTAVAGAEQLLWTCWRRARLSWTNGRTCCPRSILTRWRLRGEGRRAFALLQVAQILARAEAELRCLAARVKGDAALSHSLRLVAGALGFTDLAAQLGMLSGDAAARQAATPGPGAWVSSRSGAGLWTDAAGIEFRSRTPFRRWAPAG